MNFGLPSRSLLSALGAITAAVLTVGVARAEKAPLGKRPPNIVIILTDDQGFADYSAAGTKDVHTPNIDRVFRDGVTLRNFRTSCVCSPSRASLMTGRVADRAGVPGVIRSNPNISWGWLNPDAVTLPQVLQSAGYHTALIGKWHLGLEPPNLPNARGFDLFHGFLGDMMNDYWTHLRGGQNLMRRNAETIEPQGHATDIFTDWACAYLAERGRAPAQPFFLLLAYNAPHAPLQPPAAWLAKVRARDPSLSESRAKLVALIEHLDAGIGRVLSGLEDAQLDENTLLIFTSDNGGELDDGANNGRWRSGKRHLYEGGLRVPFAARWPGQIKPGTWVDAPVAMMDIFATACVAAGVPAPAGIDAVSQLGTLRGNPPTDASTREFYFVFREGSLRNPATGSGKTAEALIRGDWKIVQDSPFASRELYNLRTDPEEKRDLAREEPKVFAEMAALLMKHIQRGGQVPWQPPATPSAGGSAR